MAFALADRVKFTTTTTGTGTITVSAAVAGYVTPAGSGQLSDGDVVPIFIEGSAGAWEHSLATLGSTQTTLTRVLRKSSTGSLLSLTGTSTVFIDPGAADLQGGLIWVKTVTGSAVNIDVEDPMDVYDVYKLVVSGLKVASADSIYLRFKIGGSYLATNSDYFFTVETTAAGVTTYAALGVGTTRGITLAQTQPSSAACSSDYEITIFNPASATLDKTVVWDGKVSTGTSGAAKKSAGIGGCATSTAAITGLRLCTDGGVVVTVDSAVLYGLKK